jgi:hypothetical protein
VLAVSLTCSTPTVTKSRSYLIPYGSHDHAYTVVAKGSATITSAPVTQTVLTVRPNPCLQDAGAISLTGGPNAMPANCDCPNQQPNRVQCVPRFVQPGTPVAVKDRPATTAPATTAPATTAPATTAPATTAPGRGTPSGPIAPLAVALALLALGTCLRWGR